MPNTLFLSLSLIVIAVMELRIWRKVNQSYKERTYIIHHFNDLLEDMNDTLVAFDRALESIKTQIDKVDKRVDTFWTDDMHRLNIVITSLRSIKTRLDKVNSNVCSVKFRVDKIDIEKTKQILTPKVVKTINRIMKHNEGKWMSKPKVSVIRKNRTTGTKKGKVKYSNLWGYLKDDMK